jgi:hypothetical protein
MGKYSGTTELLQERGTTHGSFHDNARNGQMLREAFRSSPKWAEMPLEHREALDHIAGKLSRILSGQSRFADHWADIQGYAKLAQDVCDR